MLSYENLFLMKVLIGCEYSGITRDSFKNVGWDAWSCDLLPTERPGKHIQGNVLDAAGKGWDLFICHPPCKYLSYAAKKYWNDPGREEKRQSAMRFFMDCWNVQVDRVALENPLGYTFEAFRSADQILQPYFFGESEQKRICLWLRGLPKLIHTPVDTLFERRTHTDKPSPVYVDKSGKRRYFTDRFAGNSKHGAHLRAKSFASIAKAMAEQWTEYFYHFA